MTIPGIGLLIATALVAFVGDIRRFPSGRHFASYLGLTPRESSSALRRRLGSISKRGDVYLRTLLIHGARSVLLAAKRRTPDRLRAWALAREAARPQQGRHRSRQQARQDRLGRLEARPALPLRTYRRLEESRHNLIALSHPRLHTDQLMAQTGRTGARTRREQGCAPLRPCHPIGTVRAYTPHGPEHTTAPRREAGDTTAVRPSSRRPTAAKEVA